MVEAVYIVLTERKRMLEELKHNLRSAQERMKKYADLKRKPYEFNEGEWVWLKLQPYRQHSVDRQRCQKRLNFMVRLLYQRKSALSPSYRLKLPADCKIFPIFHIALLKRFTGDNPNQEAITLPPLSMDAHPVIIPRKITAYRLINRKGRKVEQVLIDWLGLGPDEKTWEDISVIARLVPSSNLEAKVNLEGVRDVIGDLDLNEIVSRLKDELEIVEPLRK